MSYLYSNYGSLGLFISQFVIFFIYHGINRTQNQLQPRGRLQIQQTGVIRVLRRNREFA